MKSTVLITGANGQLGMCLQDAAPNYPEIQFVFKSKEELDITNAQDLETFFHENGFTHCINTAAYTNVEKAESEPEKAFEINADAVKNLAIVCRKYDVTLLHISTDYVFDGKKQTPYTESDQTNPINVYGESKLKGEQYIQDLLEKYFIFRTSWLYSQYGHNFYKSILRMADEGKPMTITTEQIGTPTNANDLARAILEVIKQENTQFGLYHFSNGGETTWYDFAKEILELHQKLDSVKLVQTNHYRTFAQRPEYSVLDNGRVKRLSYLKTVHWKTALSQLINQCK
ncbi:MAG TPA: dTDP-4-dehydrorhamnose reductase [Flavobacteriaceae bacterium]|nr:dTDP-4-dehydrorhamnose reductase [Flavobacteriaceae bacterium]